MKRTKHLLSKTTLILSSIFLLFSSINCSTTAQSFVESQQRIISINMSATELVPADLIIFNININAEEKTSEAAYNTHKKRETVLASLLQEFDIKEEEINFQPIRMSKRTNYNNRQEVNTVQTNQQVSVSFSEFEIYEKIQVALINNGFDSFSGNFSSSQIEEGKDKALISAIQKAKERAAFIAEQSGVKLGQIKNISYSEHQINRPQMVRAEAMMAKDSGASMMDFSQTVSVTSNISINFEISN